MVVTKLNDSHLTLGDTCLIGPDFNFSPSAVELSSVIFTSKASEPLVKSSLEERGTHMA